MTRKSVTRRVPKDVDDYLRKKMPKYSSESRWRFVYDNSAFKLDEWLGGSMFKDVKKKKR